MSAPLAGVLARIASATGALRVRATEVERAERNGGGSEQFRTRIDGLVTRLEQLADELEDALA